MDLCYNYFLLSCSRKNCALNFWVNEPPTLLRTGILCYLLSALLLQGELYLEAGVPPHHEDQAGVDLLQVALIAPCHPDHLPEESHCSHVIRIICLNDHIYLTSSGSSAWRIILIKLGSTCHPTSSGSSGSFALRITLISAFRMFHPHVILITTDRKFWGKFKLIRFDSNQFFESVWSKDIHIMCI